MDNLLIILAVVVGIAMIVAVAVFTKKKHSPSNQSSVEATLLAGDSAAGELIEIPITQLPSTTILKESSLTEITDSTVISRVSALIPAGLQTVTGQAANKAVKALHNTELVKMDIPFSKLTKSKDVAGAARGYVHGSRGVAVQANLTKVDMTQAAKATAVANGVANVMNVGSLVVGQYYMTEISDKLEKMSDSINKISDFQDREFKSRIISLIARVKKYSAFSSEIIENNELCLRILGTLEDLEGEATKLLGQVNIEISDIAQKTSNPTYQEYQKKIDDFSLLVEYQNMLVAVLAEISNLTYLLGKGETSRELSYSLFHDYMNQTVSARNELEQWHNTQVESLRIDLDKNRKSKNWFAALPGIINENWKYQTLTQGLADKINHQSQTESLSNHSPKDIFEEDVEIIIREGRYYYLHNNEWDSGAEDSENAI